MRIAYSVFILFCISLISYFVFQIPVTMPHSVSESDVGYPSFFLDAVLIAVILYLLKLFLEHAWYS